MRILEQSEEDSHTSYKVMVFSCESCFTMDKLVISLCRYLRRLTDQILDCSAEQDVAFGDVTRGSADSVWLQRIISDDMALIQ